jgi:hypothetical protein
VAHPIPFTQMPKDKITAKFSSMQAFLSAPFVDALHAKKALDDQDVRLFQLPLCNAEQLAKTCNIKLFTAERIVNAAKKFLPE